jgi:serine/threonine protein kinase/tetratricopeptide (TPR) repeat protein
MSDQDHRNEETLPADDQGAERRAAQQPTLSSACARPRRYGLASRMDRAQAFAGLFGEPAEQVRLGRFELRGYLGGGGMGEVYAAYDEQLDREVAIKMVRPDRVAIQSEQRLLREAQVLAKLDHPNVVHVYEAGELEKRLFLVMKLIRGRSLRIWLQELHQQPSRARLREVLRRFVAAGRGLQAAHAAGVVHRDFKPDNVLVGDDGSVRVVDFGLARPVTDLVSAAPPGSLERAGAVWLEDDVETLDDREGSRRSQRRRSARVLTSYGQILGTPRYMSPEQMRGTEADHRSDQFSFCVSLYEALYLQMPFSGAGLSSLLRAVERGEIAEPPRGSKVPAAVRKAIWRGLAADPAARFPDMGALLDVLEPWQHPRRWARAVAASILSTAIVGGSLMFALRSEPCSDAGAAVAELWTPERRSAIREAFARTDLSYAAATWSPLEDGIDRYARRLESEMVTTCKATPEQQEGPSDLRAMRILCLASRQRRFGALLEQLEHADASMVERAPMAAAALPDLAACEHLETLRYGMKPPAPAVATQVDDIRDRLAQARTEELLGRSDEALRIAREQLKRARAVAYGPVEAEALYQTGRVLVYRGTLEQRDEGEDMLLRAAHLAESERHDELVVESWNFLVLSTDRNHSSSEQAHQWYERADAAIRRIGDPLSQRADALRNLGRVYKKEDKLAKAEAAQRQALAALESAPDAPPLTRAVYQHDLAITVHWRGRYQEAQEIYERALALHIAELGETHPHVADVRYDLAMLHVARGDFAVARERFEAVLRVHDKSTDVAHPVVGNTHLGLSEIALHEGDLQRAREHIMQSLAIHERVYGEGHAKLAPVHERIGAIEFRRGAYEEAIVAYEKALAINVEHLGPTHSQVGREELNIAEARLALGQHDQALAALDRAEAILQPALPDNPTLAPFLASVRGRALLGKGEHAAAVVALERAVQRFEALSGDPMPVERADASWALVQALSNIGREDDPRALALARAALEVYVKQGPEVRTPKQAVSRWLAVHGGR